MSYSSTILADNPQAYYRCAESSGVLATDSSGNGYTATLSGVTAYTVSGALSGDSNTALTFTAAGGLLLPSSLGYTAWSAFTIEFWINVVGVGGDGWHYIVLTSDRSTTVLYRDATVVTSGVGSGPDVLIGALYDFMGVTGTASLDEIAVYNVSLPLSRIQAHYLAAGLGGGSGGSSITLSMPASANFGFNYYHESMGYFGGSYSHYSSDLTALSPYTKNLKVYHNPLPQNAGGISRATSLTLCQTIVTAAKSAGFYVVWVENIDQGHVLTDVTTDLSTPSAYKWKWSDYSTQVVADAASAQSVGADEFLVGNEIQGSNHYYSTDPGSGLPTAIYNGTTFPGYVSALAGACAGSFSGLIGYQEVHTAAHNWVSSGLSNGGRGNCAMLYFNLYDQWSTFQSKAASLLSSFGAHVALGEVSSIDVLGRIGHYVAYTETDWARELVRRYDYARQVGIPIWLFTYGDPNTNGYGVTTNHTTYHDVWNYITGSKSLGYTQYFHDTFVPNDFSGGNGGTSGELDVDGTHTLATAATPGADYVYRGACIGYAPGVGSFRILARYSDANTYYALDVNISSSTVKFLRRQAGVETILGSAITWPPSGSFAGVLNTSTPYDFEIRVQGTGSATSVEAFFNTYKLVDQVDSGNTSLNSPTIGLLYNGVRGGIQNVVLSSLETSNTNGGGGGSVSTSKPLGQETLGMTRLGDGKMTTIRGYSKALPLSYTISPSKYNLPLPLTYTIMRANVASLLLYYLITPHQSIAINGDGTIIFPDRITYTPRPVTARTLLAAPIIQGYQIMNWQYTQIEPDRWAHLVSFYNPQSPVVTLTYPDDTGTWVQRAARMLPPVWGAWETMLVSGATLQFVIPNGS